jgi:hypothetical protein
VPDVSINSIIATGVFKQEEWDADRLFSLLALKFRRLSRINEEATTATKKNNWRSSKLGIGLVYYRQISRIKVFEIEYQPFLKRKIQQLGRFP